LELDPSGRQNGIGVPVPDATIGPKTAVRLLQATAFNDCGLSGVEAHMQASPLDPQGAIGSRERRLAHHQVGVEIKGRGFRVQPGLLLR
jgi:hypothetical protein